MQTMRARGARFLFSESLVSAKVRRNLKTSLRRVHADHSDCLKVKDRKVQIQLSSGKTLSGDGLLYALGRQANTDALNLEAVGLTVNKRGLISVNDDYQTAKPNMYEDSRLLLLAWTWISSSHFVSYAAGDCIGYPALASTSMEQGRLASVHMWNPDEVTPSCLRWLRPTYCSNSDAPGFGLTTISFVTTSIALGKTSSLTESTQCRKSP